MSASFPTPSPWFQKGYMALFAVLPWSVGLDFGTWNLVLPSEPIIAILAIGLLWFIWNRTSEFWSLFLQNRFLQISAIYLILVVISAFFSTIPLVSAKFCLVELTHWLVFAVGISIWPQWWRRALPLFVYSLLGVAMYTLFQHAWLGFRADQALLAPKPFFLDHTAWAAVLSMVVFLRWNYAPKRPVFQWIEYVLIAIALVLSTARAAWISVVVACFWGVFVVLRPALKWAIGGLAGVLLVLAMGWLGLHWQPDVSAQERVNRWKCSLRMAQARPVWGFGPGTFSFQYFDFQRTEDMTRISLRKPLERRGTESYGRGGGAHSEYLRVLAESGWLTAVVWLVLVGLVLVRGGQHFEENKAYLLALYTFFAHSWVNEFLHEGKIACLVWGLMAMLFVDKTSTKE